MYTKSFKNLALFTLLTIGAVACQKKDDDNNNVTPPPSGPTTGEVGFEVSNYFGDKALTLNTETYTTASGESVTISKFNYFITNIKLKKADGTEYVQPESYYPVKADVAGSKHFHIKDVPAGTYTSISFLVGVDSARNVSGAQTGGLDPANAASGMFWTWSTGYIMAQLEGTSPQSTATDNKFIHHVGGFKGQFSGIRAVTITLPQQMTLSGGKESTIKLKADINKWFSNNLKIVDVTFIMGVNETSKMIADNYATMFSVTSVVNE
ncbi:MAG TPA: MbnP family protein [Flavipsychrobacter sp.]